MNNDTKIASVITIVAPPAQARFSTRSLVSTVNRLC